MRTWELPHESEASGREKEFFLTGSHNTTCMSSFLRKTIFKQCQVEMCIYKSECSSSSFLF